MEKKKMQTHKLPQQAGFDIAIIKWWFCHQYRSHLKIKRELNGDLIGSILAAGTNRLYM
jgi:hypothetical protein